MGLLSADSDVFVGLGFRAVLWAIMTIIGVAYTVVYANRIAKDPAKSLVHGVDVSDLVLDTSKDVTVTGRHVAGAAEHFGRYDYDRHRYAEGLRRREVGH